MLFNYIVEIIPNTWFRCDQENLLGFVLPLYSLILVNNISLLQRMALLSLVKKKVLHLFHIIRYFNFFLS